MITISIFTLIFVQLAQVSGCVAFVAKGKCDIVTGVFCILNLIFACSSLLFLLRDKGVLMF